MSETVVKTSVDPTTANLNETIAIAEVKTKGKVKHLDARYVLILDPVTGKTLGASDFLSKTTATFQQQADAAISQANPVSTTLYTVLAATANVRIISISATVTWAVTQPNPLEVLVTIDGNTLVFIAANPVSATPYFAVIEPYAPETTQILSNDVNSTRYRAFLLEGRSVQVQVRVTWAVTQPTPLVCRVKYAKR